MAAMIATPGLREMLGPLPPNYRPVSIELSFEMAFTPEEVDCLFFHSSTHYDGACKGLSVNGFIKGMKNQVDPAVFNKPVATLAVNWDRLDIMAKIMEVKGPGREKVGCVLEDRIHSVFRMLRTVQNRLNGYA